MAADGIPVEVLVAPDSFKGTFSARQVADAVGAGLMAGGREVSLCPVADGGEGTLDALRAPLGLELVQAEVRDPLGRPICATFGLGDGVAVVEMAAASGLGLIAEPERDAWRASSFGTGELIKAAIEAGARTVYMTVGPGPTTDGGAGAIEAIGSLGGAKLVVLGEVLTPFERAAAVFGAELRAGAGFVLEALHFNRRMLGARAVVVGEGRIDRQTLAGKIAGEIATRARQSGVPCHAVVGQNDLDRFDQRILDLQCVIEAGTLAELEAAGRELAHQI